MKRSQDSLLATIKLFQPPALLVVLVSLTLLGGCAVQRDREAARFAAARIHSQMLNRNFATIYDESASGFKTIDESEFVARMNELQDKLGRINNLNEIAYQTGLDSRVGRTHALVFDLQCDLGRARETLVLVRAGSGEMQLWKLGIDPFN